MPLIDHHCHGIVADDLDQPTFEALLIEGGRPRPGCSAFDSMLGTALLRWCAPVLDLPPFPTPARYLERRAELGWREASRRLLRSSGVETWLVDTGFTAQALTDVDDFAELGGAATARVTRLETVMEDVARCGVDAAMVPRTVREAVYERARDAVAIKSIVAYREGLGIPATPPSDADVGRACGAWLAAGAGRLTDPVLLAWLVHLGATIGAEVGVPLQIHTGFGDPDLRLHRADPLLLTDFLVATVDTGVSVMLLHCWPYQRAAGYLAHVFPHVYADVGLAVPRVGARADRVIAELLELAPFAGVCYSSDGYGLAELHHLGALLWRHGLGRLVDEWLDEGLMSPAEAERLVSGFAFGNAERAYHLSGHDTLRDRLDCDGV